VKVVRNIILVLVSYGLEKKVENIYKNIYICKKYFQEMFKFSDMFLGSTRIGSNDYI